MTRDADAEDTDELPLSRWSVATRLIQDRKLGWAMAGGGGIVGISDVFGFDLFPCPFKRVTGLPCPGCGMTHATRALLHGDLVGMVRFHPFAPVFLAFWGVVVAGLLWPRAGRGVFLRRLERLERWSKWPLWVGVTLLGYSLTRWFVLL